MVRYNPIGLIETCRKEKAMNRRLIRAFTLVAAASLSGLAGCIERETVVGRGYRL